MVSRGPCQHQATGVFRFPLKIAAPWRKPSRAEYAWNVPRDTMRAVLFWPIMSGRSFFAHNVIVDDIAMAVKTTKLFSQNAKIKSMRNIYSDFVNGPHVSSYVDDVCR